MSYSSKWYITSDYLFDRNNLNPIKQWWLNLDKINYLLIISIMIFGFFMVVTASPFVAKRIGASHSFFIKKQLIFIFLSIFILSFFSFLEEDYIKAFAIVGFCICIISLIWVLINGFEIKGAKRWISLFGFAIQPSEFTKVLFLVCNAFVLSKTIQQKWFIKYGLSFGLYFIVASLLMLQPDFGMTFILTVTWLIQLFVFGLPWIFIGFVLLMLVVVTVCSYYMLPHVASRINRFLDIDIGNYQVERSIDAYKNGGLFGTGIGNGFVKKHIPDSHTDFIFAVISEELGLIFSLLIMLVFFIVITRVIRRIANENDNFMSLATIGLISLFSLQTLVNIGVSMGILPTKGMTLPFISYGGSSLFAVSLCFGIILSFTRNRYDSKIDEDNIILKKP